MAGIHSFNPETPEGKYPIVLRRDGMPVKERNFVIFLKDPCAEAALRAYAQAAREAQLDINFCDDVDRLAEEAHELYLSGGGKTSDPDAPLHRKDNPIVIAWANSIGNPGS